MDYLPGTEASVQVFPAGSGGGTVSGELKKWHKITVTFLGPAANEDDNSPNPFLDYRLTVNFSHAASGESYAVPGYFAGDGSGGNGNLWIAHFCTIASRRLELCRLFSQRHRGGD